MIKVNPNDLRVSTMTEIAYIPKRDIPGFNSNHCYFYIILKKGGGEDVCN